MWAPTRQVEHLAQLGKRAPVRGGQSDRVEHGVAVVTRRRPAR